MDEAVHQSEIETGDSSYMRGGGRYIMMRAGPNDLFAALGVALYRALAGAGGFGGVCGKAIGGFANLAKARILVHPVLRFRMKLFVDRLAPSRLPRPVNRAQFNPAQVLIDRAASQRSI